MATRILVGLALVALVLPLTTGSGSANSQPDFASPEIINSDRNDGADTSDAPNHSDKSDAPAVDNGDANANAGSNATDTSAPEPGNATEPVKQASEPEPAAPEPATTIADEPATKSADGEAPMKAAAVTVAPPALFIEDVPGCSAGKMCIVCLAGCNGPRNAIIHAAPRAVRN